MSIPPFLKCILEKTSMTYSRRCRQIHTITLGHNVKTTYFMYFSSYRNNYILCTRGRIHRYPCWKFMPWFWFHSCPWARMFVAMTTCFCDSPTSRQGDITCWCLTRCLTSRRSRTYRTPELKRAAEASPASSCPD